MTPHDLKNGILQLAIQGKIVPQKESDGDSKCLLESASNANKAKIKGFKQKVISAIDERDCPFEIPKNWHWVRLGSVCMIARGGSPRPIKDYLTDAADGINWIKISDTDKSGKYITSTKEKIKKSGLSKTRMVHKGDFLLTNSMSFGRPYILKVDGCIHDGWLVISQLVEVFDKDYLYYLLSSAFAYYQFCGKASGAVVKNLNSDKVANSLFPLPPLAEQKRIVAKIESLMPLVDEYERLWCRLVSLNKEFPGNLEKSILQFALQGKLVPQLPEEGVGQVLFDSIKAERKKLFESGKVKRGKEHQPVSNDDIPFDIPSSWAWARVGDVFQHNTGKALNSSDSKGTLLEYITTSNVYWNRFELGKLKKMYFTEDEIEKCSVKPGDLLVLEGGDFGRAAIWQSEFSVCIQNHIHRLRPYLPVNVKFFYYVFLLYKGIGIIKGKGIGIQGLSANALGSLVVPLPPVEEQNRIVAKIDELMLLIEPLKPEEKDI